MGTPWAHSANAKGSRHALSDHLLGTARRAQEFGAVFGAGEAAFAVGLLHDAGKVSSAWQQRLFALEAGSPAAQADHKGLGAHLVAPLCAAWGSLAILGHHGQVPNAHRGLLAEAPDAALTSAFLGTVPEAAAILDGGPQIPRAWMGAIQTDPGMGEFATRMLHSTLVDADFLDTAEHFRPSPPVTPPGLSQLWDRWGVGRRRVLNERPGAPVDLLRDQVYAACLEAAERPPGIFRLAAPTGSGKTMAAAAFALRHAAHHDLKRVVVAVPYLSITEQNAAVYRRLLGNDGVLEHHSAVEPGRMARYGVENWDAPFVVTTTVQLFDSLFSNRPSVCRKLHRLARAVIVLDEVQALPPQLLPTILDGLRILVSYFGTSVLLSSATQPVFEALRPWQDSRMEIHEIVDDAPALYAALARVRFEWAEPCSLDDLVHQVSTHDQALVIVNTTADSRRLARLLHDEDPERVLHLSTRMCQAHRLRVLAEVRHRLGTGSPVILVSTQLIEAGVDVDFPIVFRALAPAEALLQAAGRANREGRLDTGRAVVVRCPELGTLQAYAAGVAQTVARFGDGKGDPAHPMELAAYYRALFAGTNLDGQPTALALQRARNDLQFEQVADTFRMIEDDSAPVVVDHGAEASRSMEILRTAAREHTTPTVAELRAVQPFVVSIPRRVLAHPGIAPYLDPLVPGLPRWTGTYDDLVGVDETSLVNDFIL